MARRPAKKKSSFAKKRPAKRAARTARPARKIVKRSARIIFSGPREPLSEAPPVETQLFRDDRLPTHYGDDKLVLLVRDPWWLFAYWEITPGRQEAVTREIEPKNLADRKTVLRVYDVTGTSLPKFHSFFDIELNFYTNNWYIDVGMPDRQWVAEVGFRLADGRFFPLVRSNSVRTPSFGISDVLDEEWMLPEDVYYRLIGQSIGANASGNSMDIRKMLEKYLKTVVSSERPSDYSKTSPSEGARVKD